MSSTNYILRRRGNRAAALLTAGGVLAGSAVLGLFPTVAGASSHREAPLIAADPAVDNTDTYAFVDPNDPTMVNLIGNWIPFEEPNGGPNFYPWATDAAYDFNIDNDGDADADLIYRWEFSTQDTRGTNTFLYNDGEVTSLTDPNLLFQQTYDLTLSTAGGPFVNILDDAPVAPSFTGLAGMPDYAALRAEADVPLDTGVGRSVATQADDSFFLDLRVFDLLYGTDLTGVGQDTLAGYNVNTIALQVPADALAINGDATLNPVFGVWSTTSRESVTTRNSNGTVTSSGPLTQVSRLGQPLVNEVVIPSGLKDAFNALAPLGDDDIPAVVDRVLNPELPYLIEEIYGVTAPGTDGNPATRDPANRFDILEVFLTGIVTNDSDGAGADRGVDIDANPATPNPIDIDLNSQALNTAYVNGTFEPSEMLRLNTSITGPTNLDGTPRAEASRLGVIGGDIQGFPNGRRLIDDVVDIEIFALEGVYDINNIPADRAAAGVGALAAGDEVDVNQVAFDNAFPYVALPNTEAVNQALVNGVTAPPTAGPGTPTPAPVTPAPGQYPVGGVDTGAGGWDDTLMPALTGAAALLLLGAGAGSFIRGRQVRTTTPGTPQV